MHSRTQARRYGVLELTTANRKKEASWHTTVLLQYLMVKLNKILHGRSLLLMLDDIFTDFIAWYTDGVKLTEPQMKSASKMLSIPEQKDQQPNNS